ncbi:MAG: VCBS repeat-containing protein [Candidatus Hydrogenedentes bacterium]|nr:VCBS repeat-containing protein [Candidatus Hydrogenedentota bacterium]
MLVCAVLLTLAQIRVEAPAYSKAWQGAPACFEVGQDVRSAAVFDEATSEQVPCKVQQHRDKRYVFWNRADDGTQTHGYNIVPNPEAPLSSPVFVGGGDMMDYGRGSIVADMGFGLWAQVAPIDWDEDGDWDVIYSTPDAPQNGTYLYIQTRSGVFQQTQRLGDGLWFPAIADMNGDNRIDLFAGKVWYDDIKANGLSKQMESPVKQPKEKLRGFMIVQVDWDGDGVLDLVSATEDWEEYGWDRGFDETGNWTRGPLHGFLYMHRNTGTNQAPVYAEAVRLEADDTPIDVYGRPCPCIADFDGDGDLDLICGEFRDEFTYFENVGTRSIPRFAAPRPVMTSSGVLRIDLCMMSPVACDWNLDGMPDLFIGPEDGRVSVCTNRGMSRGAPHFSEERFLKELDPPIKSGALVTPWMNPETKDIYCGNTAGYLEWFRFAKDGYREGRNLGSNNIPFRIMAGYNGSVQGPAEEKWGYTVPVLGDVTGDGRDDLVFNSIIGRIEYMDLDAARGFISPPRPVIVTWPEAPPYPAWNWWKPGPTDLAVHWRSRPQILDWDKDGANDLVMLDHEGYLAFYRAAGGGSFEPGQRVFKGEDGQPLRLNEKEGGGSGRANIHLVDWDADGDLDLIRNTENTGWFENTGDARFVWKGNFPGRKLAGHNTAPQAIDWNGDGQLDLIVGAEDGHIYCYHRAAVEEADKVAAKAL